MTFTHMHVPPVPDYPKPQWDTVFAEIVKNEIEAPPKDDPCWGDPDWKPPVTTYMITFEVDDQFGENYHVRAWWQHKDEPGYWDYVYTEMLARLEEYFV